MLSSTCARPPRGVILHRVLQQVSDDLNQPRAIAFGRYRIAGADGELDTLRFEERTKGLDLLKHQLTKVDRF